MKWNINRKKIHKKQMMNMQLNNSLSNYLKNMKRKYLTQSIRNLRNICKYTTTLMK